MNLDHLRYFIVTSETLHTGKAGKIVNVSQSTISHSVRKLEEELGVKLFENVGKKILLTEAGKKLSVQARELLNHEEQLKNVFRGGDFPLEGTVRIGAVHGVSDQWVAPALAKLWMLAFASLPILIPK